MVYHLSTKSHSFILYAAFIKDQIPLKHLKLYSLVTGLPAMSYGRLLCTYHQIYWPYRMILRLRNYRITNNPIVWNWHKHTNCKTWSWSYHAIWSKAQKIWCTWLFRGQDKTVLSSSGSVYIWNSFEHISWCGLLRPY